MNKNSDKVSAPMTEVPTNKEMNDKDILNDILLTLKDVSNNYSLAIDEMSNKELYKEIYEIFNETKAAARAAFELAFSKGWYTLELAQTSKIKEASQKFKKAKKELD